MRIVWSNVWYRMSGVESEAVRRIAGTFPCTAVSEAVVRHLHRPRRAQ